MSKLHGKIPPRELRDMRVLMMRSVLRDLPHQPERLQVVALFLDRLSQRRASEEHRAPNRNALIRRGDLLDVCKAAAPKLFASQDELGEVLEGGINRGYLGYSPDSFSVERKYLSLSKEGSCYANYRQRMLVVA